MWANSNMSERVEGGEKRGIEEEMGGERRGGSEGGVETEGERRCKRVGTNVRERKYTIEGVAWAF